MEVAARESGAVAEQAAQRKLEKYRDAFPNYCFQPTAVENLGALNSSAVDFINTLFQRIAVTIQRFNSCSSLFLRMITTNSHSRLFCF